MQHIFLPGSTDHFVQGKYSFETHSALFPDTWDQHTCSNGCLVSCYHLGVSSNWSTPKWMVSYGKSHSNGGYPYSRKPPMDLKACQRDYLCRSSQIGQTAAFFLCGTTRCWGRLRRQFFRNQVVRKLWLERFIREDRWTMDTHGHA